MHLEVEEEMVTPPASPPDSALSCPGETRSVPQHPPYLEHMGDVELR